MKKLFIILSFLLIASSSSAVVEPGDNMMGFYFDQDADVYSIYNVPPFSSVTMYLTLVNPTFEFLYGFEVGFHMDGTALFTSMIYTNPQVIDVGIIGNNIVGFGEPTSMTQANILATLTVLYMDDDGCDPVDFYMHGTTPSSINPDFPTLLLENEELMIAGVSRSDGPSSTIYGDCTVPTTGSTLGGIKSLYR